MSLFYRHWQYYWLLHNIIALCKLLDDLDDIVLMNIPARSKAPSACSQVGPHHKSTLYLITGTTFFFHQEGGKMGFIPVHNPFFCHISSHQLIPNKNSKSALPGKAQLPTTGMMVESGLTGTFIRTYKSSMEKFLAVAVKSVGRLWNKTIFPTTTKPQLPLCQNISWEKQTTTKTQLPRPCLQILQGDAFLESL